MMELLNFEGPKIVAVGLVSGGWILTGKRRDNGKWTSPGGHIDEGEELLAAAKREVLEESGIELDNSQLEFVHGEKFYSPRGNKEIVVFAFLAHVDKEKATGKDDPDKEISTWKWVPLDKSTPELQRENRHAPDDFVLIHLGILKRGVQMSKPKFGQDPEDKGRGIREVSEDLQKANLEEVPTAPEPQPKTPAEMQTDPDAYVPNEEVGGR